MSPDWHYVPHPDGSFTRVVNMHGHLDHLSDDELAVMKAKTPPIELLPMPSCSRCKGDLLL